MNFYAATTLTLTEDVETNRALSEKLIREFGLELPSWDEESSLGKYFAEVVSRVERRDVRWKVRRWVTVGLFTFDRLAMYRDLNDSVWPVGGGPQDHDILKRIFAGSDSVAGAKYAQDHDVDGPGSRQLLPHLVAEADASQHSAVLDVISGLDLVIQGPPGTGKSQTITNIISAALGAGKSVLFVAEKMPALEVVQKRLESAGLGDFCLVLHSHKTNKSQVLNSVAKRMERRPREVDASDLEETLAARERARLSLARYAKRISQKAGATQMTVHEILWGCRAREKALKNGPRRLLSVTTPGALEMARNKRDDIAECARILESEQERLAKWGPWDSQPWRGVQVSDLGMGGRDEAITRVVRWRDSLERVSHVAGQISQTCEVASIKTAAQLRSFAAAASRFSAPVPEHRPFLVACSDALVRDHLRRLADAQIGIQSLHAEIASKADLDSVLRAGRDRLQALQELARGNQCDDLSLQELLEKARSARQQASELGECARVASGIAQCLEGTLESPLTPSALTCLVKCIRQTVALPKLLLWSRDLTVMAGTSLPGLCAAATRLQNLRQTETELAKKFDLSAAPSSGLIREAVQILRGASWWSILFGKEYRRARRLHRNLLRQGDGIPRNQAISDLCRLAEHFEQREGFLSDPNVAAVCGAQFRGIETDFESLQAVASWAAGIRAGTPSTLDPKGRIRNFFFRGEAEDIQRLLEHAADPWFEKLCKWTETVLVDAAPTISSAHSRALASAEALEHLHSQLAALGIRREVPANILCEISARIADLQKQEAEISSLPETCVTLVADLPDAKPQKVLTLVQFADLAASAFPAPEIGVWLLQGATHRSFETLDNLRNEAAAALEALEASWRDLELGLKIDSPAWCGSAAPSEVPFNILMERAELAANAPEALEALVVFLRAEGTARREGLGEILDAFRAENADYSNLPAIFEASFYFTAASALLREDPDLREHSGQSQEANRRRFQDLDREIMRLGRDVLVTKLLTKPVPEGNGKGPRGTWTERAFLTHQTSLQKRHAPLRSLLERAGGAVRALKPCFMMSPMSVAQYLSPDQPKFDLVVIDEASQVRPEDALGAILRGRQLVVVGDSQQLPPTSFFTKVGAGELDEDEDEELGLEGQESILDLAKACFGPVRTLNWHYRSKHESLIAFSNREFYDGRLVVFPSPCTPNSAVGVEYVNVQGTYENQCNELEADAVVEAVLAFAHQHKDRSLAVVTVNAPQRELLNDKLRSAFAEDPVAQEYLERWQNETEPFDVKNLENVQGDERDVIFVSTVYGRDQSGGFHQRFGPINSDMGHRRLNVLFTRAKYCLRIFSSMTPEMIRPEGCKKGVSVLKNYLTFARDGSTAGGGAEGSEPENDFERWFRDRLVANGYGVVPQYGVAGYRIDLAIRHPKNPRAFVLGVECDGASYHSCRSARERDRLRQEVLEKLGWRLHRVWSTDWFRNPELELERLLGKLKQLAQAYPPGSGHLSKRVWLEDSGVRGNRWERRRPRAMALS